MKKNFRSKVEPEINMIQSLFPIRKFLLNSQLIKLQKCINISLFKEFKRFHIKSLF